MPPKGQKSKMDAPAPVDGPKRRKIDEKTKAIEDKKEDTVVLAGATKGPDAVKGKDSVDLRAPRAECSRMLTFLKYRAGTKGEDGAQKALQYYANLPDEKKAEFVTNFDSTGKDAKKNIGEWLTKYDEKNVTRDKVEVASLEKDMNRHEILKINGLDPVSIGDEAAQIAVVETLVQDSEAKFDYKATFTKHPTLRLLDTWFYVFSRGVARTHVTEDSKTLELNREVSQNALKNASSSGASSSKDIQIKIESPELKKCKDLLDVVRSGEKLIVKHLATFAGLKAQAESKGEQAKHKVIEIVATCKALTAVQEKALKLIYQNFKQKTEVEAIEFQKVLGACKEDIINHCDAAKLSKKRITDFLNGI